MSAEEALARAKAIAARLQQTGGTASDPASASHTASSTTTTNSSGSGTTTGKRRRWGLAPEGHVANETNATSVDHDAAHKRVKTTLDPSTLLSKRVWISTGPQRPAAHFVNFLRDELPAVVHKLTSSLSNNNSSSSTEPVLLLELQGRGSSGTAVATGIPLEPLHVLCRASTQHLMGQAEAMVEDLLQQAEETPVHPDLLANSSNHPASLTDGRSSTSSSLALATIQDPASLQSNSTASYRPASVAQLIGQVVNPAAAAHKGPWIDDIVSVPIGVVGFIIGKGGENIASLQAKTGVKVQIQRDSDGSAAAAGSAKPPPTQRHVELSAPSQEALDHCKQLIQNLVEEKTRSLGGGVGGSLLVSAGLGNLHRKDAARLEEALAAGHVHVQVPVPDADVGLVIGKGGATIRSLQDRTGATIQVPSQQESQNGKRTLHITHPTQQGAEHAQQLIQELLKSTATPTMGGAAGSSTGDAPGGSAAATTTIIVPIPDQDVGLCIGKNGVVIRHLQQSTQTRIQIPSDCPPGERHRMASITGTPEACQHAQALIQRIVAEQSSASVMFHSQGGPSQAVAGSHPYAGPTPGQEGYSAEWAAYHAAQQAAAAAAAAAPPAAAAGGGGGYYAQQPQQHGGYHSQQQHYSPYQQQQQQEQQQSSATSDNSYHEQFFRYAYYYGEEAARSYYGAWAPPVGAPNPYGVNPNGIQPAPPSNSSNNSSGNTQQQAPSSAPASQSSSGPSPSDGAGRRETSRRKVSNLPAWMTNKN